MPLATQTCPLTTLKYVENQASSLAMLKSLRDVFVDAGWMAPAPPPPDRGWIDTTDREWIDEDRGFQDE